MMGDPPRLRTEAAGLEALLLRSSRSVEPPPSAEEEVWRRLQLMTAAGAAAGATGLAASTAAGSKVVAKALWLSVLKWSAVVVIAVPAAGMAVRAATHRPPSPHPLVMQAATPHAIAPATITEPEPTQAPPLGDAPGHASSADVTSSAAVVGPIAPVVASRATRSSPRLSVASKGGNLHDAPSALRKESLSLGTARAQFAAGDPQGALDEVGRLGDEFPDGRLVQEREVLAIDCLAALGDGEGARSRATAFLKRFPASPYRAHVRSVAER